MRSSWFKVGIPALLVVALVAGSVFAACPDNKPWAPNQYTFPSRIYDDGTYVEYFQWFLWDQGNVDELHSRATSNGKYQHEFTRDVDKWDAENWLCQDYGWWTNLPKFMHQSKKRHILGVT